MRLGGGGGEGGGRNKKNEVHLQLDPQAAGIGISFTIKRKKYKKIVMAKRIGVSSFQKVQEPQPFSLAEPESDLDPEPT